MPKPSEYQREACPLIRARCESLLMEPAHFYSGIAVDAYAKLKSTTFHAGPYTRFIKTYGEPALELVRAATAAEDRGQTSSTAARRGWMVLAYILQLTV